MTISRRSLLASLALTIGAVSVTSLLEASAPKIEETKFKVGDLVQNKTKVEGKYIVQGFILRFFDKPPFTHWEEGKYAIIGQQQDSEIGFLCNLKHLEVVLRVGDKVNYPFGINHDVCHGVVGSISYNSFRFPSKFKDGYVCTVVNKGGNYGGINWIVPVEQVRRS